MYLNELEWLQKYYLECCDGDWEHTYGIKINNIDNPGWKIEIDIHDTILEDVPFKDIQIERTENDWLHCVLIDKKFKCFCGPLNLGEIISVFRQWIEECKKKCDSRHGLE